MTTAAPSVAVPGRHGRCARTIAGSAGLVLAALLAAGCGTAAPVEAPPAAPSVAPTAPEQPAPVPGVVRLAGDVRDPRDLRVEELAGLPQQSVTVEYGSGAGPQRHTEQGVLLADLLPVDALATTDGKHDELSFGVLATGSDGYAALVSYGEIAPEFGNRGILLATTEDGAALPRPRLAVPGDVRGGRYVSDVVELRVVRTADQG